MKHFKNKSDEKILFYLMKYNMLSYYLNTRVAVNNELGSLSKSFDV
jgi:hypothetical protein